MLPDLVLLGVFDFYLSWIESCQWKTLVHVCRKWRTVVFGSPRRLRLQLVCFDRTSVKKMVDVWPQFLPIIVFAWARQWAVGNIIAALRLNDRVCEVSLSEASRSKLEVILAAMQKPFPALTHLRLGFKDEFETGQWPFTPLTRLQLGIKEETPPVVSTSFLGGSAPLLQNLSLIFLPFPGLPNLLLSTTHLVRLVLRRIPHSGYISPEAMVAGLANLTRLECLVIGFESPLFLPDRRPPPQTRTLLPVLTILRFHGVAEYSEDLVARIDAPLLKDLSITYFHQDIFHTAQLTQFICRTPRFSARDAARVVYSDCDFSVRLPQTCDGNLQLGISCRQPNWQLLSLAQVCGSSFPRAFIPAVERLYVFEDWPLRDRVRHWRDVNEISQWLELFRPFSAVKDLHICREFTPLIAPALQELVGERVTEVLPALQTIFFEEQLSSEHVQETVGQFVAARQLAGHPITISLWER